MKYRPTHILVWLAVMALPSGTSAAVPANVIIQGSGGPGPGQHIFPFLPSSVARSEPNKYVYTAP